MSVWDERWKCSNQTFWRNSSFSMKGEDVVIKVFWWNSNLYLTSFKQFAFSKVGSALWDFLQRSHKIVLKCVIDVDIHSWCLCRGLIYYRRSTHKVALLNFLQRSHKIVFVINFLVQIEWSIGKYFSAICSQVVYIY